MNGILLIDKPPGITSAEVVRRIKRMVKPDRVGHLGTLDPFATGLLPILIGEATKLAQFIDQGDKHYEGGIALGIETDTCDPHGEIVRRAAIAQPDIGELDALVRRFTGEFEQVPPVYSAIKRDGVPLYKLARRGEEVEPPAPRRVRISELRLEANGPGLLEFHAVCSPGTYMRSLARDIGIALGGAAHLACLRRTRTAGFAIDQARTLDAVMENPDGLAGLLVDLEQATTHIAGVQIDDFDARRLRNGDISPLLATVKPNAGVFRAVCEGNLVAIGQAGAESGLKLLRVFLTR